MESSSQAVMIVIGVDWEGAEAVWQRRYVHLLRNALDYLPRKADNDCMTELLWIYDRRSIEEARQDLPERRHPVALKNSG